MRIRTALPLLAAALLLPLPAAAQSSGTVLCDARIKRIVKNLREQQMTPDQTEGAHKALYDAIDKCRPQSHGSHGAVTSSGGGGSTGAVEPPSTQLERQSLRAQQNVLTPAEEREGERRLDAIDRKAQTDPRAARDMQRIWEADRSLSTINRPTPGGPVSPSLVGPGDRN